MCKKDGPISTVNVQDWSGTSYSVRQQAIKGCHSYVQRTQELTQRGCHLPKVSQCGHQ